MDGCHTVVIKQSLGKKLLEHLTMEVPDTEEILHVEYFTDKQQKNIFLTFSIEIVVGFSLVACFMIGAFSPFWKGNQEANIAWYAGISIACVLLLFFLFKNADRFCNYDVYIFTNKKIRIAKKIGGKRSLLESLPITCLSLDDISAHYYVKNAGPGTVSFSMNKLAGSVMILVKKDPLVDMDDRHGHYRVSLGPFEDLPSFTWFFESYLEQYQKNDAYRDLSLESPVSPVQEPENKNEFKINQERIDEIRQKQLKYKKYLPLVIGIIIGIMILPSILSSFIALGDSYELTFGFTIISLMFFIFGPLFIFMFITISIQDYRFLAKLTNLARGTVSVDPDGLVWTLYGVQENLKFAMDLFFMLKVSTKSTTLFEWSDIDTLILWSTRDKNLKVNIGPIDNFSSFYTAFIMHYRMWLKDQGLTIEMDTAASGQIKRDPIVMQIIEKVRHPAEQQMDLKNQPILDKTVSKTLDTHKKTTENSRSRYSEVIYDVYNEPGEKTNYFYTPKHVVETFFSPGTFIYFFLLALTFILWFSPDTLRRMFSGFIPTFLLEIFFSFIGPLLLTLITVMFTCLFFTNKVSLVYFSSRLELRFSDRKMIAISSGKKITIIPKANFSGVTFKKTIFHRNRYGRIIIHFKVPVKTSPYLAKNLFFLQQVDKTDPVLALIDEFVKGNQS